QRYTGKLNDPQWRADVLTWLSEMQQALHHLAHPLILIPNLGYGFTPSSDPQAQQAVSRLDGILDESGFTKYGQGYLTGGDWVKDVRYIQSVQQQHKAYYIVNAFPSVDASEIQWALASYLMAKEHTAYLTITRIQGYGSDLRYGEYNAQVGSPTGEMFLSQNIYWRDYSDGLSLVNPSPTSTYMVRLPGGSRYVDLNGNQVSQTVTLLPHSGLVLLTAAG
ncbi:MAG TPA: putative glycoside hydrolase, partial [Ktedonobacteraceae bacterium]|nr:putative glycoside hydrolase [Ktedonobacteraceae bacterium]